MDELVDPNGCEMHQRRLEAHQNNGGVEVVEPVLCDSSTLHSGGSLPSIFSSSAYDPSQHPFTSADEMYASDTYVSPRMASVCGFSSVDNCRPPPLLLPLQSQDDGATHKSRSWIMHRHSFSGDVFVVSFLSHTHH